MDLTTLPSVISARMQPPDDASSGNGDRDDDEQDRGDDVPLASIRTLLLSRRRYSRALDTMTPRRRRRLHDHERSLVGLLLEPIPANWAELQAYIVLICACHLLLRIAMVAAGFPTDQNLFSAAGVLTNYLLLVHYASTSYLLGTVSIGQIAQRHYLAAVALSSTGFTMLGELSFFHTSLTRASIVAWSPKTILGYSIGAALMVGAILYQALLISHYSRVQLAVYGVALVVLLTFHALLFEFLPRGVHLHHWYIAWIFMFLMRSKTTFIETVHAIATGVFLQGIASYGCAPVVFDSPGR